MYNNKMAKPETEQNFTGDRMSRLTRLGRTIKAGRKRAKAGSEKWSMTREQKRNKWINKTGVNRIHKKIFYFQIHPKALKQETSWHVSLSASLIQNLPLWHQPVAQLGFQCIQESCWGADAPSAHLLTVLLSRGRPPIDTEHAPPWFMSHLSRLMFLSPQTGCSRLVFCAALHGRCLGTPRSTVIKLCRAGAELSPKIIITINLEHKTQSGIKEYINFIYMSAISWQELFFLNWKWKKWDFVAE